MEILWHIKGAHLVFMLSSPCYSYSSCSCTSTSQSMSARLCGVPFTNYQYWSINMPLSLLSVWSGPCLSGSSICVLVRLKWGSCLSSPQQGWDSRWPCLVLWRLLDFAYLFCDDGLLPCIMWLRGWDINGAEEILFLGMLSCWLWNACRWIEIQ